MERKKFEKVVLETPNPKYLKGILREALQRQLNAALDDLGWTDISKSEKRALTKEVNEIQLVLFQLG